MHTTTMMRLENSLNVSNLRMVSEMRLSRESGTSVFVDFLIWWIVAESWKKILPRIGRLTLVGLLTKEESNIWTVASHMVEITRDQAVGKGLVGEILRLLSDATGVVSLVITFEIARVMRRSAINVERLVICLLIAKGSLLLVTIVAKKVTFVRSVLSLGRISQVEKCLLCLDLRLLQRID